jgi:hypothetical protein
MSTVGSRELLYANILRSHCTPAFPVGFHRSTEQIEPRPDAWCSACEQARLAAGGDDWPPEVEAKLGIKLLCGACYDSVKTIWLKGRKITQ